MDKSVNPSSQTEVGKCQPDKMSFFTGFWTSRYTIWIVLLMMGVNIFYVMETYNPGAYPGNPYILSHYLLSYELAFMPRALTGTIYQFVLNFISARTFFVFFLFFQTLLILMLTLYFYRCIAQNRFSSGAGLLFFSYLLLPSTYLFFFDFGRFDGILLALAFAAVLLIHRQGRIAFVLVPGLMILGVLIHEVFLFFFVPTIFAWSFFYVNRNDKKTFLQPVCIILGGVICLYLLYLMRKNMPGGSSITSFIAAKNQLTHTSESMLSVSLYAGEGLKAKSYLDHFREMFCNMQPEISNNLTVSLISFAACMPVPFYLFWKFADAASSPWEKYKILFLSLAALSPLGLCLIGVDFGRWCSAAMWCIFLTGFSLFCVYKDRKINIPWILLCFQIILFAVFSTCKCTELTFCQF